MAKQGFLFAVLAALAWGLAPLFAKVGLVRTSPLAGVTVRSIAVTTVVIVTVLVSGHYKVLATIEPGALVVLVLEGFLGGLIGQYFYFKAIKSLAASTVVPIVGAYPLFTFLLAVVLLSEKVTVAKSVGVLLVVSGIIFLGL